jgi:hypothetical protein
MKKFYMNTFKVVVSASLIVFGMNSVNSQAMGKALKSAADPSGTAGASEGTSDSASTGSSTSAAAAPSSNETNDFPAATGESGHACARIPEGSSVTMKPTLAYFDDPAASQYLLNRKPSINGVDQYEIVLNYQFTPANPAVNAFVTSCFQKMSQYLQGPNGEQITLRLPKDSDPQYPQIHAVEVAEACGYRGEALCWRPEYTCPTILHETMHHLGLVDEYADAGGAGGSGGTCRSIGPADSLMTNFYTPFVGAYPTFHANIYKCDIFTGGDQPKCLHALDLIQAGQNFTPDKATSYYSLRFDNGEVLPVDQNDSKDLLVVQEREVLTTALSGTDPNQFTNKDGFEIPDSSLETLTDAAQKYASFTRVSQTVLSSMSVSPGKKKSILYPAESSTLLYGKCSANETFLTCEHNAYASHMCGSKPAVCPTSQASSAWLQMPDGVSP